MNDAIDFTPRERMLINYYKDRNLAGGFHSLVYHLSFIAASALCLAAFLYTDELAWGFAGYGLLMWKAVSGFWSDITYAKSFCSVFEKYDTRLRTLQAGEKPTAEKHDA